VAIKRRTPEHMGAEQTGDMPAALAPTSDSEQATVSAPASGVNLHRRTPEQIRREIESLENDRDIRRASGELALPNANRTTRMERLAKFAEIETIAALSEIESLFDYADFAGQGYSFLGRDDKMQLVGRPLVIVHVEGGYSRAYDAEYALCWVLVANSEGDIVGRHRFIDFGAGIRDQLLSVHREGSQRLLLVRKGLTASTYDRVDDNGNVVGKGTSYYLSEN
jgi:hypothetical protein